MTAVAPDARVDELVDIIVSVDAGPALRSLRSLDWWAHRTSRLALVLVDPEDAADRLCDQRYDNAREVRDIRMAYRLAAVYDDGARYVVAKLLDDRVDMGTRWGMIEAFQMGYATLRDCLVYDQGVNYLLACVVAFDSRTRTVNPRSWL